MSLIPWTPSSYPPLTSKTIPFLLHILLELPASILFFLSPSTQLPHPYPPSHPLIRQYAILLLSSNLIALVFLVYRVEGGAGAGAGAGGGVGRVHQKEEEIGTGLKDISPLVAGSLAIYHIAPSVRALSRIVYGDWASGGGLPEEEEKRSRKGDGRTRWLGGLGGPWVHLVAHAVCFVALGMVFVDEGVWGRGGARV